MLKAKIKHQSFSSETLDIHPTSFPPDPKKVIQTSKEFSQQAHLTYCKHY